MTYVQYITNSLPPTFLYITTIFVFDKIIYKILIFKQLYIFK